MRLLELYQDAIAAGPAGLVAYLPAVRDVHELSWEGLSHLLAVSITTLRHWRQGTRMPSTPAQWRSLQRLAAPDSLDTLRIERTRVSHPGKGRPKQKPDESMQRRVERAFDRLAVQVGSQDAAIVQIAAELQVTPLTVRRWIWPTPIGWARLIRLEEMAAKK